MYALLRRASIAGSVYGQTARRATVVRAFRTLIRWAGPNGLVLRIDPNLGPSEQVPYRPLGDPMRNWRNWSTRAPSTTSDSRSAYSRAWFRSVNASMRATASVI